MTIDDRIDSLTLRLHDLLAAVAPISGVSIGSWDDKSSWRVDFKADATEAQRSATKIVIDDFDVNTPTADEIEAEARRRKRLAVNATDDDMVEAILARGTRMAVRLLNKDRSLWTAADVASANRLELLEREIDRIDLAADDLRANPVADYADDRHWL